jgi:chromosome segregation ATPase
MCKKLVIAAVAILVGTAVIKHTTLGSLAQVWWHDAKAAMERQVPPEVQIKQLAIEVGKIEADIKRNLSKLAQQEVDAERLDGEVTALRNKQETLKADIAAMSNQLEKGNTEKVTFNGKQWRTNSLSRQLDVALTNFESVKAQVKSKEKALTTKRDALEAAHARISEMKAQEDELQATVEELKNQLEVAKLNAARNHATIDLDDSQVARCRDIANNIRHQLKLAEKETELQVKYGYGKSQSKAEETKPTADILKAAKKALQDDNEERVVAGK